MMKQRIKIMCLMTASVLLLLGLAAVSSAFVSSQSQEPSMESAAKLFQAQQWAEATAAYEAITQREPSNGLAWLQLGLSRHSLKQYERAISAYGQAEKLGFALPRTRYNLACAHALQGEKDKAFEWLDKAVAAGFAQVQTLKTDTDLASLRSDARFEKAVEKADQNARPCEYDARCRQFDFWIGEWDVLLAQGQKAGTNVIRKTEQGCLILENWTSTLGGTGKSMNYYDTHAGQWKQLWVDSGGRIIAYEGAFQDGAMRFEGRNLGRDGSKELSRMTFTPLPDGRVRQFIEQSRDDGKTWYVWFDGYYVRKK